MGDKNKTRWFMHEEKVTSSNPPELCAKIIEVVLKKRDYIFRQEYSDETRRMELVPGTKSIVEAVRKIFLPDLKIDLVETENGTECRLHCELSALARMITYILIALSVVFIGSHIWQWFTADTSLFSVIWPFFLPIFIRFLSKGSMSATSKVLASDIERILD